jgi:hypothetical protein
MCCPQTKQLNCSLASSDTAIVCCCCHWFNSPPLQLRPYIATVPLALLLQSCKPLLGMLNRNTVTSHLPHPAVLLPPLLHRLCLPQQQHRRARC